MNKKNTFFFFITFLFPFLFNCYLYSQEDSILANVDALVVKYRRALADSNKFIFFNGCGLEFGFTSNVYGWSHPDPYLAGAYFGPHITSFGLGAYSDLFFYKYIQTVIYLDYWYGNYDFTYNIYNGEGQNIGTRDVSEGTHSISIRLVEQLRYNFNKFSAYLFAGPRGDFRFDRIENIDFDFQNVFRQRTVYGLTIGFGTDVLFSQVSMFLEFYFNPDITKTYSSTFGQVRYNEIGFLFGIGFGKKANK